MEIPTNMPTYDSGAPWQAEHDLELLRAMTRLILSNRSTLYLTPALADVANNKGDRINKKLQIMLKRFVEVYPGTEGLGKEEVAAISASKPWKRKAKDEGDIEVSPGKKHKGTVKKEAEVVKSPKKDQRMSVKVEVDELDSE